MQLAANDRGLAYGDGIFETLRFAAHNAPLRVLHKARMRDGAARLSIPFDGDAFDDHLDALLSTSESGIAKIILTRGSGGRGYAAPVEPTPRWVTQRFGWTARPSEQRQHGLVLGLCHQRVADMPSLAGLKHLNRLEQVLAQQQVSAAGWDEGLLLDQRGRPLELTSMNLFARFGDELFTPDLHHAGVAGVARQWCLNSRASSNSHLKPDSPLQNLTCRQGSISLSRLREADEVFACNSVAGILPVRKLALWQWPVGEVTRLLQAAFDEMFT